MADLNYIVEIEHSDKGIGYSAKKALDAYARQPHSPINQARITNASSGNTSLIVNINDSKLEEFIRKGIEDSGRMPTHNCRWSITSIYLEENYTEKTESEEQKTLRRDLYNLREENNRLKRECEDNRVVSNSPLEGLLSYFDGLKLTPTPLLEEKDDIEYARRVFSGEIENILRDYVNHMTGENFSEEDIEKRLSFEEKKYEEENNGLKERYEEAVEEVAYMERIRLGKEKVPPTIRETIIKTIEDKGSQEIIEKYKESQMQKRELEKQSTKFREYSQRFQDLKDKIDLINGASESIPVIFNGLENNLEMYLPFKSRSTKPGFVDDLEKELSSYFQGASIERIESNFVGYRLNTESLDFDETENLSNEVPFILRIAGFNKITPLKIGF